MTSPAEQARLAVERHPSSQPRPCGFGDCPDEVIATLEVDLSTVVWRGPHRGVHTLDSTAVVEVAVCLDHLSLVNNVGVIDGSQRRSRFLAQRLDAVVVSLPD